MRRPWIKIETATPDKPEICAIASRLRMDEDMVVGKLVRLWSWVALNRVDGSDLGVTLEFIDKLVSRKGFSAALCHAGWLIERDGKLSLPNFDRHNSDLAKTRALTSQRVARHRVAKNLKPAESNSIVTSTPVILREEQDTTSTIETSTEEPDITNEQSAEAGHINPEAIKPEEESPFEESEEDLENVLSINAIPTFKPLHLETTLAKTMAIEEHETSASSAEEVSPPPPAFGEAPPAPTPSEETNEPLLVKKSRRKTESEDEGQPMLF